MLIEIEYPPDTLVRRDTLFRDTGSAVTEKPSLGLFNSSSRSGAVLHYVADSK